MQTTEQNTVKTIFIPGVWQSSQYLSYLIPDEYLSNLEIVDLPQYCDKPSYSYDTDLTHVLDYVLSAYGGDEPINVITHSYGTQIALGLAESGVKINKAVFFAPMLGRWWVPRALLHVITQPFTGRVPWWMVGHLTKGKRGVGEKFQHIPHDLTKVPKLSISAAQLLVVISMFGRGKYGNPTIPTRIVRGVDDEFLHCDCETRYSDEHVVCIRGEHAGVIMDKTVWHAIDNWFKT